MIKEKNRNSQSKPPKNIFRKILIILGLFTVILAFFGGIATAVLFLNWKKIVDPEQLPAILSPLSKESPSTSVKESPSSSASPTQSPSALVKESPSPSPTQSPSTSVKESPSPSASPTQSPTTSVKESPSPSPTQSPSPSESKIANSNEVERQGLLIKLQNCQKSTIDTTNQRIVCTFSLTSKREDVAVTLYGSSSQKNRSRIVYGGNERNATGVKLGIYSGTSNTKNSLTKNAPLTASFTFEKVPLSVKKIGLLEVLLYLESSYFTNYIKVNEFRDVPLSD